MSTRKKRNYLLILALFVLLIIIFLHFHLRSTIDDVKLQQQKYINIQDNIMFDSTPANDNKLIKQLKSNMQLLRTQYNEANAELSKNKQQIEELQHLLLTQKKLIDQQNNVYNNYNIPNKPEHIIRIIWILWFQGWQNAPKIPQIVLKSWKYFNADWTIIPLSDDNLPFYVDNYTYWRRFVYDKYPFAGLSDIVRIELLKKYGGVWVDSTVFCTKSLNEWLFTNMNGNGFFAFDHPRKNTQLSSWFLTSLYVNKSYIMNTWHEHMHIYWTKHKYIDKYWWLHGIFDTLYEQNSEFRKQYDNVSKWSADGPHKVKHAFSGIPGIPINKKVVKAIDAEKQPMFKLQKEIKWNWTESDSFWESNVGYLIQKYIFVNQTTTFLIESITV